MLDRTRNLRLAWLLALALILVGGGLAAHRLTQSASRRTTNPCRSVVTNPDELCGMLNVTAPK
jgi:hypothetical protein